VNVKKEKAKTEERGWRPARKMGGAGTQCLGGRNGGRKKKRELMYHQAGGGSRVGDSSNKNEG